MFSIASPISLLVLINLFLVGISFLIWYIFRKKRKEINFPILQLFLEKKPKPSLKWKTPNLFVLFCFLLFNFLLLIYTAQFKINLLHEKIEEKPDLHLLIDLSASVSSKEKIKDYQNRILAFYYEKKDNYKITFSKNTNPGDIIKKEISSEIKSISYSKKANKIGKSITKILSSSPDLENFVIFSDKDQYSWEDFNWEKNSKEKTFLHIKPPGLESNKTNVFISNLYLKESLEHTYHWDVTIQKSGGKEKNSGLLKVYLGNKLLKMKKWDLKESESKIIYQMTIRKDLFENMTESKKLIWTLEPSRKDLITLDNELETYFQEENNKASLIIDPHGESTLKDPAYHLENLLSVIGYQIERHDSLSKKDVNTNKSHFSIRFIKEDPKELDSYCSTLTQSKKTWITPERHDQSLMTLCQCLNRFSKVKDFSCKENLKSEEFSKLLLDKGYEQIGGDAGISRKALAWRKNHPELNSSITIFMLPLKPSLKTGLTHSLFPKIVQIILDHDNSDSKPRNLEPLNNVPKGESLLREIENEKLPVTWASSFQARKKSEHLQKKESYFVILALILLALFTLLIESAYHFKAKKVIPLLLVLMSFSYSKKGFSEIKISYLQGKALELDFSQQSREVSERTSLEISPIIQNLSFNENKVFEQPWLWLDTSFLLDKIQTQEIKSKLTRWIKQGGFLVLENTGSLISLPPILEGLNHEETAYWKKIPVDHELFKSFYLLNSFPSCPKQDWYILEYDNRLVSISIPYSLISSLQGNQKSSCHLQNEMLLRSLVNITMVALTTNYKNEQIHIDEILKRLQ